MLEITLMEVLPGKRKYAAITGMRKNESRAEKFSATGNERNLPEVAGAGS